MFRSARWILVPGDKTGTGPRFGVVARGFVTTLLASAMVIFSGAPLQAAKCKKAKQSPEKRFAKADVNKDAKLSLDEFIGKRTGDQKAKTTKRFAKVDKDSDGFVTLDELKAAPKKKKSK